MGETDQYQVVFGCAGLNGAALVPEAVVGDLSFALTHPQLTYNVTFQMDVPKAECPTGQGGTVTSPSGCTASLLVPRCVQSYYFARGCAWTTLRSADFNQPAAAAADGSVVFGGLTMSMPSDFIVQVTQS